MTIIEVSHAYTTTGITLRIDTSLYISDTILKALLSSPDNRLLKAQPATVNGECIYFH